MIDGGCRRPRTFARSSSSSRPHRDSSSMPCTRSTPLQIPRILLQFHLPRARVSPSARIRHAPLFPSHHHRVTHRGHSRPPRCFKRHRRQCPVATVPSRRRPARARAASAVAAAREKGRRGTGGVRDVFGIERKGRAIACGRNKQACQREQTEGAQQLCSSDISQPQSPTRHRCNAMPLHRTRCVSRLVIHSPVAARCKKKPKTQCPCNARAPPIRPRTVVHP